MPNEGYLLVIQPHRMGELYERTRSPETLALWGRVTEAGGLDRQGTEGCRAFL